MKSYDNIKLPPLPDWTDWHPTLVSMSVSEIKNSIQAYATAAIEADRQVRGGDQQATPASQEGQALRDYFAAKAMAAMVASPVYVNGEWSQEDIASQSYQMADVMLKTRETK